MNIDRVGLTSTERLSDTTVNQGGNGARAASSTSSAVRATLSTDTDSIASLTTQAMQTPPMRMSKVQQLRQSVANHSYALDARATAAAMLGTQGS